MKLLTVAQKKNAVQKKNVARKNLAVLSKSAHQKIAAQNAQDVQISATAQNHVQKKNAAHLNKNVQNAAQNQNHAAQAMVAQTTIIAATK